MTALQGEALLYTSDARGLWNLTASELDAIIGAGRRKDALTARQNELLAFNTAALVLAAFNAPKRFPRTPDEAFGRVPEPPADGGKSAFMAVAEQINKRLKMRANKQEQHYDH